MNPLHPWPQNPAYHLFADTRAFWGVPNFWNVVSNLAFLAVGVYGLMRVPARKPFAIVYATLFAGFVATAFGSAYYHWNPTNATLVWDRLPMTLVFMSLVTLIVGKRRPFVPLLAFGIGSVLYWQQTDDLRPYALAQFGPAVVLLVYAVRGVSWAWGVLGWYAIAKLCEMFDPQIYALDGGLMAGHALKHIAATYAGLTIQRAYGR